MTTGYSRGQLDKMEELFAKKLPRVPTEKDKKRLPMVDATSAAGSPFGIWVRFHLEAGQYVMLFLNPVTALLLLHGINECAIDGGWWKEPVRYVGNDMPVPTGATSNNANKVISLTTASAGDLIMVHFVRRGGSKQMLGMWRQAAVDLFLTLQHAGQQFHLWDKDFNLLPAENSHRVTDLEIWRAANQLSEQFSGNAQTVATERSLAAYAVGDMFNFEMWERVAKAAEELGKTKPAKPEAIN
jgi:hypothetical protein